MNGDITTNEVVKLSSFTFNLSYIYIYKQKGKCQLKNTKKLNNET